MARHVYIHFHDEQGREPDGRFAAGGSGHAMRSHPTEERAHADVAERRAGLESHGFKHERDEPSLTGTNHHFSHPDGSRAVVTHAIEQLTGRHKVSSLVNTMNQGKRK